MKDKLRIANILRMACVCGGRPEESFHEVCDGQGNYAISCNSCSCSTPDYGTLSQALNRWNLMQNTFLSHPLGKETA